MTTEARVLSTKEPWLWAIRVANKRLENRRLKWRYRGEVLLQRSVTCSKAYYNDAVTFMVSRGLARTGQEVAPSPETLALPIIPSRDELMAETGGIVARTRFTDCIPPSGLVAANAEFGFSSHPAMRDLSRARWRMHGQYAYVLGDVEHLPFIPCRGYLGLFRPKEDVLVAIAEHDAMGPPEDLAP